MARRKIYISSAGSRSKQVLIWLHPPESMQSSRLHPTEISLHTQYCGAADVPTLFEGPSRKTKGVNRIQKINFKRKYSLANYFNNLQYFFHWILIKTISEGLKKLCRGSNVPINPRRKNFKTVATSSQHRRNHSLNRLPRHLPKHEHHLQQRSYGLRSANSNRLTPRVRLVAWTQSWKFGKLQSSNESI